MLSSGLVTALINTALFLIVVGVRYLLHQEGPRAFGLHLDSRGRRLFGEGLLIGALAFCAYPLLVLLLDRGELGVAPSAAAYTGQFLAVWLLGFLAVALFEESLFRGYVLPKFLHRFPLPIAIALPALLFGLIHLLSFDTSRTLWLGIANASLFGVAMSLATIAARSLMWAVGCNMSWNLTKLTLLGGQNSDAVSVVNLSVERGLLTGTPAVPESGLIVTAITLALVVLALVRFGRPSTAAYRAAPPAEATRPAPGRAPGGDR